MNNNDNNSGIPPDDMDLVELLEAGLHIVEAESDDRPPDSEYELQHERVVSLDRQTYTRREANQRFEEIAQSQGLVLLHVITTARYYCYQCLYLLKEDNER